MMLLASTGPTLGRAAADKLAQDKAAAAQLRGERRRAQNKKSEARQQRLEAKAVAHSIEVRPVVHLLEVAALGTALCELLKSPPHRKGARCGQGQE